MKTLLVTSDWHVDWITHGVDRFPELMKAVERTVHTAIEKEVDAYLFTGDLCDPDSGSRVFRCVELALRTAIALREARIPSFWLAGNHDVIEDGSGESTLTPLNALADDEFIHVAERPGLYGVAAGINVLALPFTPTSHSYDPTQVVEDAMGKGVPFIVAAHLSVPGCIPGEETKEMPRGREVVFPLDAFKDANGAQRPIAQMLINGHYHRRQFTNGVHIPGSLARLTFNEEENYPGFLLAEVA